MRVGLEGIKIIETASDQAVPVAGRMCADLGADVIKIENAVTGDLQRFGARRLLSKKFQRWKNHTVRFQLFVGIHQLQQKEHDT